MKGPGKFELYWLLWAAAVCVCYWWIGPMPLFSRALWTHLVPPLWRMNDDAFATHFSHFTQLLLFWILCAGLGRSVLKQILPIVTLNPFESLAFSFGLGAGILGYFVMALAAFKVLTSVTVVTTTGVILMANLIFNRDLFSKSIAPQNLKYTPKTFIGSALLIGWVLFLYGFYALSPETFHDALVYHLALPQLYKTAQGFVPTPQNFYSGLPFLMQMLYTWALFISDEILAKLIHWSAGAGLAIGFLGLCLRHERPALASLLACAFLTTPVLGFNVSVSGVDVASSYMVFLAVYALSMSFDENTGSWETLSAIFCGFALELKYTNWPLLPVVLAALMFVRRGRKSFVRVASIALLLLAPCVIRNLVFYGNPIYPYFHESFEQNPLYAVDWKEIQKEAWQRDWGITLKQPRELAEAILQPFVLTFRGGSSVDYIGPLFLAALPLIFFRRGSDKHRVWLIVFAGLWLSWWLTTTLPRFFLPGLAVLAACFCLRSPAYSQRAIRLSLALLIVVIIFHNTAGFSLFMYRTDSWDYLIFGQSKSDYLSKVHVGYPSPYFASADWINTHTPPEARVMVIGDARGAYLERRFIAVARWNRDPLFIWVQQSKTAEDLKHFFDQERMRYLLINMAEVIRRPKTVNLTPRDIEVLETFFRQYAMNRFADRVDPRLRWSEVWEIVPSASSPVDRKYPLVEWLRFQLRQEAPSGP